MERIVDYIILEKLNETRSSITYRGRKDGETQTVIINMLKVEYPSASDLARFNQEFSLIKHSDVDGIVHLYDTFMHAGRVVLILEDAAGIPLKKMLVVGQGQISLEQFLTIARSLAATLGALHRVNIVHREVKPYNILVNEQTGAVLLTGFGIVNILTHEHEDIYNADVIKRSLVYLSPEQTGRMNRTVDYRSDLYSLGVTLYEMITGRLPFESSDPLEIIHGHIARNPIPPVQLAPTLPRIISDIILKLLSKTAEERYQNSFGLLADIQECLRQLAEKGTVESFALGQKDISLRYNIPQKLFGRQDEIAQLLSIFEAVSRGHKEVMLVAGAPGIGKSALINEIHKPIVAKRGYFAWGKYDQFRRNVPYSSLIQAFQGLVRQILSESKERIEAWQTQLRAALGGNGQVIIDILPEVELIVGPQSPVPVLDPEATVNRLIYVFKAFINVFAKKEHPLVLFLDDLQWIDTASLLFIKKLILDPEIQFLFFIGSYRNNEEDAMHLLRGVLYEIEHADVPINQMVLGPLPPRDVNDFIADFLRCDRIAAGPLAELVNRKTNGNPFFINQFMKTLYEDGLIALDPQTGWRWDMERINQMQVTDNVVELMADKITRLNDDTKRILMVCACIGNRFDLETLSIIVNKTIPATLEDLTTAIREGFIMLSQDLYRFHHDRIQEAAYSLLSTDEKVQVRYRIGKLVLDKTPRDALADKIFYIVNHLNFSQALIVTQVERTELARLNLMAGSKAKAAAAYKEGQGFLLQAQDLLPEAPWKKEYALTLALYTAIVEAGYLAGEYEQTEKFFTDVVTHARTALDKVRVYEVKIAAEIGAHRLREALLLAFDTLRMLGVRMPQPVRFYDEPWAVVTAQICLAGKKTDAILALPELTDPKQLAIARLFISCLEPSYMAVPEYTAIISMKLLKLSVRYGNSPYSAFAYAAYAALLCGFLGDLERGYAFGRLSIQLFDRFNAREQKAKVFFTFASMVSHWKQHLRVSYDYLMEVYHSGVETGSFSFASYGLQSSRFNLFFRGENLIEVRDKHAQYVDAMRSLQQLAPFEGYLLWYQLVTNLVTDPPSRTHISGEIFNEDAYVPQWRERNNGSGMGFYSVGKQILCFLFGDYVAGLAAAQEGEKYLMGVLGTIFVPEFYFYYSLLLAARCPQVDDVTFRAYMRSIRRHTRMMKKWARHAPMNYEHKWYLLEAEYARLTGRSDEYAHRCYELAIRKAHESEYIHDAAIANELTALFWLQRGNRSIARVYMNAAHHDYTKWGAATKIAALEDAYPEFFSETALLLRRETVGHTSTEQIDIKTLKTMLKTIVEEKVHRKVIEKTIHTAVKFAGAQKGFLVLRKDSHKYGDEEQGFFIEAEWSVDTDEVTIFQAIPVEASLLLSQTVVNYVLRTKVSVVVHNAQEPHAQLPQLQAERYIQENQVKSILCLPIATDIDTGAELVGLLYLENNRATRTFTADRAEVLEIICLASAGRLELSRKAITDGLTGLYNHEYFQSVLSQEISHSERRGYAFSVVMIDVDHFKEFNDRWGHQVGDVVLQKVAALIKESCRASDIVARYGGEEIVVILRETHLEPAVEHAGRLRKKIEGLSEHDPFFRERKLRITISAGVSGFPVHAKEKTALVRAADEALYASKRAGRNQVTVADMPHINDTQV